MDQVKVAVIGVGHLGKEHARVYSELEKANLACVIDANASQAQEIGTKLGVPFFTKIEDLPEDVIAVNVATPTTFHYELCKILLQKKLHVLVEKPITNTTKEAEHLVQLAKENNCKFQVGHIERFNPGFMGIQGLIKNPRYIEATRLSPYSFRSIDVSVIHDLMIHDIDIVLELAKSEVVHVEALGIEVLSGQQDLANVRLKFANGCIADITANRIGLKSIRQVKIFQKGAYITLDYMQKNGRVFELAPDFSMEKLKQVDTRQDRNVLNTMVFSQFIQVQEMDLKGHEPLKKELDSFLLAILNDTPVEVPGEDGLRAMKIIDSIFESIQENQWRMDA